MVFQMVDDAFSWRLHQAIPDDKFSAVLTDPDLVSTLSKNYDFMEKMLPLHGIRLQRTTLPDGTLQYKVTRIGHHMFHMQAALSRVNVTFNIK